MADWTDDESERLHSLIWTVDLNPNDITHLMGDSIARPLAARIQNDAEFAPGLRMIDGLNTDASGTVLRQGLAESQAPFHRDYKPWGHWAAQRRSRDARSPWSAR